MNPMKKLRKIFALAASMMMVSQLAPQAAQAFEVQRQASVPSSLEKVNSVITDYENAPNKKGARYSVSVGLFGSIQLVRLIKAQKDPRSTPEGGDNVLYVFQPLNLRDVKYYPRFVMNCKTTWSADRKRMDYACNMVKAREDGQPVIHYGLNEFTMHLVATSDTAGQSHLDYHILLVTNPQEVREIKNAAVPFLGGVADSLFNEEVFFQGFYENAFQSFLEELGAR